jgi:hypothetical protein
MRSCQLRGGWREEGTYSEQGVVSCEERAFVQPRDPFPRQISVLATWDWQRRGNGWDGIYSLFSTRTVFEQLETT